MARSKKAQVFGFLPKAIVIALSFAVTSQAATVSKIGWLGFRSATDPNPGRDAIVRELRGLGYVDGKNIAIEYRSAEAQPGRLNTVAEKLVRLRVDMVLTASTPAALAAKKAIKTIPIFFYDLTNPVGSGLIDSLVRPGGNITGITNIAEILIGKRLELLKETVPRLSRVAVLWNPENPSFAEQWKESLHPARELGLQLESMQVSSPDKFEDTFKAAIKTGSTALIVVSSSFFILYPKRITDLAINYQLPAIYVRREFVDSGGLMSYGPDRAEPYRRTRP